MGVVSSTEPSKIASTNAAASTMAGAGGRLGILRGLVTMVSVRRRMRRTTTSPGRRRYLESTSLLTFPRADWERVSTAQQPGRRPGEGGPAENVWLL